MTGIIKQSFPMLNANSFRTLYTAMVRPHVEYAVPAWSPYLRKDIEAIESVQRRATRIIKGLEDLSYENRLRQINLPTLVFRRMRGDLIEVYKILHGIYDQDTTPSLHTSDITFTRGNNMKLFKPHARLNIRKHSFTHRVIDNWNALPNSVVLADTLNSFKNKLDKLWENHPVKYNHINI